MDNIKNDDIKVRLRSPPVEKRDRIVDLVKSYWPEIQEARRNGKSWAEIGVDLRAGNPVLADTVRRTAARLTTGKPDKKRSATKRRMGAPTVKIAPSDETQLDLLRTSSTTTNAFARKVDPIRHDTKI